MTILPVAWGVEQVTVCSVDRYLQSTYPSIGRLADGRLLCVFCVSDKKTGNKMVVMGAFSMDHGRTWGEPTKLINTKGDNDYDPNIVVIGSRVIVSSTTTPPGSAITTSRTILDQVEDPRMNRTKRHELTDMLFLTLCAVMSGADGWTEVELYGQARLEWLRQFVPLVNGIPSHDTLGRVFARLDPPQLENCFLRWMSALAEATEG